MVWRASNLVCAHATLPMVTSFCVCMCVFVWVGLGTVRKICYWFQNDTLFDTRYFKTKMNNNKNNPKTVTVLYPKLSCLIYKNKPPCLKWVWTIKYICTSKIYCPDRISQNFLCCSVVFSLLAQMLLFWSTWIKWSHFRLFFGMVDFFLRPQTKVCKQNDLLSLASKVFSTH